MEIDNSIKSTSGASVNKTRNRSAEQTSTTSAPPSGGISGGTSVELSELSTQLNASSDASFDAKRVLKIKQEIAEGRFTINADAIAERLFTSARELVNSQRRA